MSLRHLAVNRRGDEADDSDSSDSISPVRVPQRASTVSPSTRQSSFRRFARRRSDFNLSSATSERKKEKERRNSQARYSVERKRGNLRKTNSEPSVEHAAQIDIEAIRQLLLTLPKFSASSTLNPLSNPVSDAEEINTEIEELRDAAKSIQSLQRVLKGSGKTAIDRTGSQSENDSSTVAESASEGRVSGISTRGHPRGVMQFLSSIRQDRLPDGIEMRRGFSRKGSAPEAFPTMDVLRPIRKGDKSPRSTRRRAVCEELYPAGDLLEKGSTALAEVSRFSRLLDSLRMDGRGQQEEREKTETEHPSISWSPYLLAPPDGEQSEPGLNPEDSLMEADLLLWKKRSRASLRRHNSMRTLAARELFDTEKSFVEGLEYLVQKYMRPLRRPLEITLIEAGLVDKIFYKIPEILAHHQVLLSSLSNRLESWHAESSVGDVLLVHFSKQSMIETYISFVDNFKYAKAALAQARQKPAFEKYYQRCCRDHRNKLDLDALLISPIQRVPRYELILNQLLKHTSIEHADHEKMLRAQRHIHQLAVAINRQQQQNEQAEQRLREIEAIVDGLEDLVTTGRTLLRYDMVTMKGRDGHRQRCVFTCSDQLIVTSVRRKDHRLGRRPIIQSSDFLDSNRFKLLIKISLTDVEIGKVILISK
ncbi:unnamed protein product, partial [Mesorhabditis belari]|uniref:DH domain-containing protein n=1 Tax=Mesorhabditis belari TaxID=2138241 RepID=A0AAF3J1Q0_9BILA